MYKDWFTRGTSKMLANPQITMACRFVRISLPSYIKHKPWQARDHWEGDIILGEGSRSAVGTLVERTSRFLLLLHLKGDRSAVAVEAAMHLTWADVTLLP